MAAVKVSPIKGVNRFRKRGARLGKRQNQSEQFRQKI
jgi:hypothetical protein